MGRALAIDPALLLLDEPMSNLDYRIRLECATKSVRCSSASHHDALVTHDREEALTLADRIVVLNAGEVARSARRRKCFINRRTRASRHSWGADNTLELTPQGAAVRMDAHGASSAIQAQARCWI